MSFISRLTEVFSVGGKARSLYRRGMVKAKRHDHEGAIEDYSAVIDEPSSPADVKAMALYNRALAHVAAKHDSLAIRDLKLVLDAKGTPEDVRTEARRKLLRIDRRASHEGD